jgi:hypothetical protein
MPLTLILILSSHRCLGDSFSAPTKPFIYTFPFYPICATCPTHLIPSVRITRTILCNLLHPLLPRPSQAQISSSTHSPTPSTYVTTKFHTQTTGITVVLYTSSSIFLGSKLEHKRCWTQWQQAFSEYKMLVIALWKQYRLVSVVPK